MQNTIKIADILDTSLVNGTGLRSVIFCTYCEHNCPGCHNQKLQSHELSKEVTIDSIFDRLEKNKDITRKKVTFSGGDHFYQAEAFNNLAKKLKKNNYNIWCYTGFTLEEIQNSNDKHKLDLLQNIDVLVDGRYIENLKEGAQKYTGSRNQKIIDLHNMQYIST